MRSVKCFCNVCGKLCDESGRSFEIEKDGTLAEVGREEGSAHLCGTCQATVPKALPNPDYAEEHRKFEECMGALRWIAQAIGISPDAPKDESKWHEWLIKTITNNIHGKLRRGIWSTEKIADVLMALDEADAPAADDIHDRIIKLGAKARDLSATHDHYIETMGKILDPIRKRRENGDAAQSDFGEVRGLIHQMQELKAKVLRLQGINV